MNKLVPHLSSIDASQATCYPFLASYKHMAALKDKIQYVLEEIRVILPGTQALLGFQLIVIFSNGFERQPDTIRYIHLASLLLVTISMVLLMTVASYHRIVEEGEDTLHFHRFAGIIITSAMAVLALGISADFLVVLYAVIKSAIVAAAGGILMFVLCYSVWFFYPLSKRHR